MVLFGYNRTQKDPDKMETSLLPPRVRGREGRESQQPSLSLLCPGSREPFPSVPTHLQGARSTQTRL